MRPPSSIFTGAQVTPWAVTAFVRAEKVSSSARKVSPLSPNSLKHLVIPSLFPRVRVTKWFLGEWNTLINFVRVSSVAVSPAPAPYARAVLRGSAPGASLLEIVLEGPQPFRHSRTGSEFLMVATSKKTFLIG